MLPSWANDTITRIRPGTRELRGSTVPDWSSVSKAEISGCSVQPSATGLSQDGRILGINEGFTCYLPPGSDVRAGDRISWNGETYTIMGKPQDWQSPTGRVSSLQIHIERWEG